MSNATTITSTSFLASTASGLDTVASSSAASTFQVWLTDYAPSTASAYLPLDTPCPRGLFASAFGVVYSSGCERPHVDSDAQRALCLCDNFSPSIVAAITNAATTRPSFCGQGVLATLAINSAAQAVNDLCKYLSHDAAQPHSPTISRFVSVTSSTTSPTLTSTYSSTPPTITAASATTSSSSSVSKSGQIASSTYTYTYAGLTLYTLPSTSVHAFTSAYVAPSQNSLNNSGNSHSHSVWRIPVAAVLSFVGLVIAIWLFRIRRRRLENGLAPPVPREMSSRQSIDVMPPPYERGRTGGGADPFSDPPPYA